MAQLLVTSLEVLMCHQLGLANAKLNINLEDEVLWFLFNIDNLY
jgi:hypothetical protein